MYRCIVLLALRVRAAGVRSCVRAHDDQPPPPVGVPSHPLVTLSRRRRQCLSLVAHPFLPASGLRVLRATLSCPTAGSGIRHSFSLFLHLVRSPWWARLSRAALPWLGGQAGLSFSLSYTRVRSPASSLCTFGHARPLSCLIHTRAHRARSCSLRLCSLSVVCASV